MSENNSGGLNDPGRSNSGSIGAGGVNSGSNNAGGSNYGSAYGSSGTGGLNTPYGITPFNVPRKDQTLQDRQFGTVGSGMANTSYGSNNANGGAGTTGTLVPMTQRRTPLHAGFIAANLGPPSTNVIDATMVNPYEPGSGLGVWGGSGGGSNTGFEVGSRDHSSTAQGGGGGGYAWGGDIPGIDWDGRESPDRPMYGYARGGRVPGYATGNTGEGGSGEGGLAQRGYNGPAQPGGNVSSGTGGGNQNNGGSGSSGGSQPARSENYAGPAYGPISFGFKSPNLPTPSGNIIDERGGYGPYGPAGYGGKMVTNNRPGPGGTLGGIAKGGYIRGYAGGGGMRPRSIAPGQTAVLGDGTPNPLGMETVTAGPQGARVYPMRPKPAHDPGVAAYASLLWGSA